MTNTHRDWSSSHRDRASIRDVTELRGGAVERALQPLAPLDGDVALRLARAPGGEGDRRALQPALLPAPFHRGAGVWDAARVRV